MYSLRLVSTVPSPAPLELAVVKTHCRVLHGGDDVYLAQLSLAALEAAEAATHRQLLTATWDLQVDRFPDDRQPLRLPLGAWQATTSVSYVDTAGDTQTLDAAKYTTVGTEPALIWPAYGQVWPATRVQAGAVTVRFTCGYGDSHEQIPTLLRQGMLLLVGHWYVNREAIITGAIATEMPIGVAAIFAQFALGDDFDDYT